MTLPVDCKKHLENITGKYIVFEPTEYMLESAVSFSQYIFDCSVLVTLIGERHDKIFKCKSRLSLPICEYCAKTTRNNPNCRVILEYYCGGENIKADVPTLMNSASIKNTYKKMKKNKTEKQIIPLDYRPYFLSRRGQDDLYGKGWAKYTDNKEKIIEAFVKPFWERSNNFAMNNPQFYYKEVIDFLQSYYQKICTYFRRVERNIKKNDPNIRRQLFDAWKHVADYFIIRKMLKKDHSRIDEYILIIGEAHRENIEKLFQTLPASLVKKIGDTQLYEEEKCVTLLKTLRF